MKRNLKLWILFILFLTLAISRRWEQLLYPNVWDEDGTIIIPGILNHGLISLFEPVNGYLIVIPKLISFLSLNISIYNYPFISSIISFILISAIAFAVAVCPTKLSGKILCASSLLLIPSDPEVFGLPLYTFWWASLLLSLLVLWDENDAKTGVRICFLLLGGLSSPVIIALLPVFYWRSYTYRRLWTEHLLSFLGTIIAVVQMFFVLDTHASTIPPFRSLFYIVPAFFGNFVVGNIGSPEVILLFGLLIIFMMVAWFYDYKNHGMVLKILLVYLLFAGIALSVIRVDPAIIHPIKAGPRYFFYPFIFLFWIIIQIMLTEKWYRFIAIPVYILVLCNVVPAYTRFHDDLDWKGHIVSSSFFEQYTFPVHYDGHKESAWNVMLYKKQYAMYQKNDLFFPESQLAYPIYPYTLISVDKVDSNRYAIKTNIKEMSSFCNNTDTNPNIPISGDWIEYKSKAKNGIIILSLKRGDVIIFRNASSETDQTLEIIGYEKKFKKELPITPEWTFLEFTNSILPNQFEVKFKGTGIILAIKNISTRFVDSW